MTPDDVTSMLAHVRRNTTELLSEMDKQPSSLHIRVGDVAIDVEWPEHDGPTAVERPSVRVDSQTVVIAQAVGVFCRCPEAGAEPFVREGDVVTVGQQVAIIEAMKLMIPVEAEIGGRVVDVLKADGEPVEYGEPLFALVAEGDAR